jgi:hypothetical protein
VNTTPRPAARVLLSGRYLVPRVSLLALPNGPVIGLDLTRGVPVTIERIPAHAGNARSIVAADLVFERPVSVVPDPLPRRSALRAAYALGRELEGRRARVTLLGGACLACGLVVASALGGTPHVARAVARVQPARRPSIVRPARSRAPALVRVRAGVALPSPASRGGPARVLLLAVAPPAPPAPVTVVHRTRPPGRTSRPSPGWVDGLVVGS